MNSADCLRKCAFWTTSRSTFGLPLDYLWSTTGGPNIGFLQEAGFGLLLVYRWFTLPLIPRLIDPLRHLKPSPTPALPIGHGWLNHAGSWRIGRCGFGARADRPDGTEHSPLFSLADVPQTALWCGLVANSGLEKQWALNKYSLPSP